MIIVLDNLDSFTYNLVQLFRQCTDDVRVYRNQALSPERLLAQKPTAIVLSPGPGRPADAGVMPELIPLAIRREVPLLGVCLGHQGIAEAFGAKIIPARQIMHGKSSAMLHHGNGIFSGLPSPFRAVRYHSLAVDETTLPADLEITCRTSDDGEIMGLRHRNYFAESVQYHPESILSEYGMRQIRNFCARLSDAL